MNKEIPLKYGDEVVGYINPLTNAAQFLDTELSKKIKQELLDGTKVSISSRGHEPNEMVIIRDKQH